MKKGYSKDTANKPKRGLRKGYDLAAGPMETPACLHITDKDLPAIKDWKVGSTYKVTLTMRQTSLSINEFDESKRMHASFEIEDIKVV